MPRKLTTDEEIKEAWDKKRERDRKAQAKWVETNREEHKRRMREQYQKRKAKAQEKKAEEEAQAKAGEERQEVVVPVVEAPKKECEVKEVPAGLSLLDVVKRIRNSYYASMRNKAGWKGKSEEAREQWKKDFVFCDDLVAKNEELLTAEHKAELTARGIALTDPRLIAKELDEGIFTAPIPEKKAPVRRKIKVMVPKEEPAPAPVVEEKKVEPEPEKPKRRKLRLAPKPADEGFSPPVAPEPVAEETPVQRRRRLAREKEEAEERENKRKYMERRENAKPEDRVDLIRGEAGTSGDYVVMMTIPLTTSRFDNKQVQASVRRFFASLPKERYVNGDDKAFIMEWYNGDKSAQAWVKRTNEDSAKAWAEHSKRIGRR